MKALNAHVGLTSRAGHLDYVEQLFFLVELDEGRPVQWFTTQPNCTLFVFLFAFLISDRSGGEARRMEDATRKKAKRRTRKIPISKEQQAKWWSWCLYLEYASGDLEEPSEEKRTSRDLREHTAIKKSGIHRFYVSSRDGRRGEAAFCCLSKPENHFAPFEVKWSTLTDIRLFLMNLRRFCPQNKGTIELCISSGLTTVKLHQIIADAAIDAIWICFFPYFCLEHDLCWHIIKPLFLFIP